MQKSDKKTHIIIRALAFVLTFVLIFAFLEALTHEHGKTYDGWLYVYEEDIDVLIMGSSQADASFDAKYITEETGKSTVVLSSGAQSIKQLYFNLEEVVKYQKPEIIVVEEFSIIEDTISWMRENNLFGLALLNLDGMKMSPLKLKAAFATLGFEGYSIFHIMRESGKTERFLYALKNFKLAFSRIFNPKELKLHEDRGTVLHHADTIASQSQYEASLIHNIDENFELPSENVIYMQKVIKLCQKHDIKLEFIKTPLIKNKTSISGHYVIQQYLLDNGYDIAAYNLMDEEYGLVMEKDDYTDVNHVSESGMQKVSEWFISHIKDTLK